MRQNIGKVVAAAADLIVKFVNGIASNVGKVIAAGANLIVKILRGIASKVKKVVDAGAEMMGDFVQAAADAVIKLTNRVARIIINFINQLSKAIREHSKELANAGALQIEALIDGAIQAVSIIGGRLIDKVMSLFDSLPRGVRKLLNIRSPSKVFEEIGKNMMLGTVIGVDRNAGAVYNSLESTAEGMIDTVVRTLRVVPDLLDGLMDMDPVITPVLDLTNVQAEAKKLAGLTNVTPITAAASYDQAASISAAQEAAQTVSITSNEPPSPTEIKFEQNNYSPEALSTLDIYRRTNNQLSQAKSSLGIA